MSNRSQELDNGNFTRRLENLLSKKNIQIWSSSLAIGTVLIYTLFGGLSSNTEHPVWYRIALTAGIQNTALLVSALLCLRNGLHQRMPAGNKAWLILSIATLSYLFGNIFFSAWETLWGLNPAGCLGDPFFVLFYLLVPISMLLTIVKNKMRLEAYQWAFLVAAASLASLIVVVVTILIPTIQVAETIKTTTSAPEWVLAIDRVMKPYANNLNYFYVWSDVFLFTIAVAIVMGFWGMKLNRAWIINSFAVTCYYISDIWLAYASNHIENYQSGFILEIFWIFGALLFGLAAVTEFDIMLTRELNEKKLDLEMDSPSDIFYK
jgi:hypothetical protein